MIVDTAGRLAVDTEMMDEIEAIKNAINPGEILFVVDAMTGQDQFVVDYLHHQLTGLDCIDNILTQRFLFHCIGERFRHTVVHVGIKQGTPNIFQGFGNIYFGYSALTWRIPSMCLSTPKMV